MTIKLVLTLLLTTFGYTSAFTSLPLFKPTFRETHVTLKSQEDMNNAAQILLQVSQITSNTIEIFSAYAYIKRTHQKTSQSR